MVTEASLSRAVMKARKALDDDAQNPAIIKAVPRKGFRFVADVREPPASVFLADGLSDLRETLALIHGATPFPVEATTRTPCAIVHHDDALFDGEADVPFIPAQEEISGGEGVFLFGDEPGFQDELPAHQHAA